MHSHLAGILYYLSDATLKITYRDGKSETRYRQGRHGCLERGRDAGGGKCGSDDAS